MRLKPRKPVRTAGPRERQEPVPAFCAFCKKAMAAPPRLRGATDLHGQHCSRCGALCIADPTGKQGGEAMMTALRLMACGDESRALALREAVDYDVRTLAWIPSTNEVDAAADATRYGVSRLWFFLLRNVR